MSRIFKNKYFHDWMQDTDLTDNDLCAAVKEMEDGLVDAYLGGGVVKKRVALPKRSKRESTRTIVITNQLKVPFRKGDKWFFVFGFTKDESDNISNAALTVFKKQASDMLALTDPKLARLIADGQLEEITPCPPTAPKTPPAASSPPSTPRPKGSTPPG